MTDYTITTNQISSLIETFRLLQNIQITHQKCGCDLCKSSADKLQDAMEEIEKVIDGCVEWEWE